MFPPMFTVRLHFTPRGLPDLKQAARSCFLHVSTSYLPRSCPRARRNCCFCLFVKIKYFWSPLPREGRRAEQPFKLPENADLISFDQFFILRVLDSFVGFQLYLKETFLLFFFTVYLSDTYLLLFEHALLLLMKNAVQISRTATSGNIKLLM